MGKVLKGFFLALLLLILVDGFVDKIYAKAPPFNPKVVKKTSKKIAKKASKKSEKKVVEKSAKKPGKKSSRQGRSDFSEEEVGFGLFPSTKKFLWRSEIKNHVEYDNNIYLVDKPIRGDGLYSLEASTEIVKRWRKMKLGVRGGFEYRTYFEEGKLAETLPFGTIDFQFHRRLSKVLFYGAFRNDIARESIVNTLEIQENSPWIRNTFVGILGAKYKKFLFEISNMVEVNDYEKTQGDNLLYGQGFLVGYRVHKKAYLTLEYKWAFIQYEEPFARKIDPLNPTNIIDPTRQRNTPIHSILVGTRIKFGRTLYANFQAGLQLVREDTENIRVQFRFHANVKWKPCKRFQANLTAKQEILPSFFGDYQVFGMAQANVKYFLTDRLHASAYGGMEWNDPAREQKAVAYLGGIKTVLRLYKGLNIEVYYKVRSYFSKQPAGDFVQHVAGGGLNLLF